MNKNAFYLLIACLLCVGCRTTLETKVAGKSWHFFWQQKDLNRFVLKDAALADEPLRGQVVWHFIKPDIFIVLSSTPNDKIVADTGHWHTENQSLLVSLPKSGRKSRFKALKLDKNELFLEGKWQ